MSIQYPAPGFERESPPITTRPGLPPNSYLLLIHLFNFDTEHNFQKEPVQPNQLTNFHFHWNKHESVIITQFLFSGKTFQVIYCVDRMIQLS